MDIFSLHNNPSPEKDTRYILDSNIWLPILGLASESLSEHYNIFFGKILKEESCRILMCPLQLSEILNRLLRYHGKITYDKKYGNLKGGKPSFSEFYKVEFRGSIDFKKKYDTIIDDIDQYMYGIDICDLSSKNFSTLTDFKSGSIDFNDNYLYLLTKEQNATIITHDGDFYSLDIRVCTYNRKLYNEYKNSIKPK